MNGDRKGELLIWDGMVGTLQWHDLQMTIHSKPQIEDLGEWSEIHYAPRSLCTLLRPMGDVEFRRMTREEVAIVVAYMVRWALHLREQAAPFLARAWDGRERRTRGG